MPQLLKRYLLALVVPPPTHARLEALRAAHGIPAWKPRIALHLTLVRPFSTAASEHELRRRAADVVGRHLPPYPLVSTGLGRFDTVSGSSLHIRVAATPQLTALQRALVATFADLTGPSDFPFTPHVTISDETTRQRVDGYQTTLADADTRLNVSCDHVALMRRENDGWRGIGRFQ